jgi:hypothetical protein
MRNVDIKYESPEKIISSRKFTIAQTWDELSDKNLFSLGKIQQLGESQAHLILFKEFSGIPWHWIARYMTADDCLNQIINPLIKPLLGKPGMKKGVMKNSFPGWIGMEDSFQNFSWARWCLVDAFYSAWITGQKSALANLCSLIYKPKPTIINRWKYPAEAFFNPALSDLFLPYWKKVPAYKQVAVALHYGALRSSVISRYPHLFSAAEKQEDKTKQLPPQKIDYSAWTITLSGGPFGNRAELDQEPVHNVFRFLDIRAKEDSLKKKK